MYDKGNESAEGVRELSQETIPPVSSRHFNTFLGLAFKIHLRHLVRPDQSQDLTTIRNNFGQFMTIIHRKLTLDSNECLL